MRRALLLLSTMALVVLLAAGVALAATITCQADVDCVGTKRADTLEGSDGEDIIYGRRGGDTLNGLGENDELYGQGGSDKVFGGPDGDRLTGGSGNDALNGGAAYDYYYFGNGWGKDSIIDSATSGNDLGNAVYLQQAPNEGYVTQDVSIRLTPGAGPEVTNKRGTNTINWEEVGLVESVDGGAGDDEILGDAFANDIYGRFGVDTVYGGGGNDYIWVDDGSGGDVVDCGEGLFGGADDDHAYYDLGDTISSDCETKIIPN